MKILSALQIKNCDAFTIINEPISSINLMERASQKCSNWMMNHLDKENFYLFCGNGNNGGDGFAIARLLYHKGFDVTVFVDKSNLKFSDDAKINFDRIKEISGIDIYDFSEAENFDLKENSAIIDALFGTGLNKNVEGNSKKMIEFLNSKNLHKISIDMPSGIFADKNFDEKATIFKADDTLSFQFYKKSFLHPETGKFCGRIHILDIGLNEKCIENTETSDFIIDENLIKKIYKPRNDFSHKGNFGKTCIVAGSFGKVGAAVLATKAALRTGSGLTFILAPKCGYEILQMTCPEAMFLYGGEDFVKNIEVDNDFTYGIGPGLGTDYETEEKFLHFLQTYNEPLVLDADALNLIAKHPENVKLIPKNSIITPHPKEFERLFGKTKNSFERLDLAKEKAKELEIYIVLKDHHSQIITPKNEVFYNITGNSGLAKGGSGDVLLGIITSLLSQGYSARNAAIFGVWLHGKSADITSKDLSKESMLATDLIENISEVFKELEFIK